MSSSPKLDAGVRQWAAGGGANKVRVIVSSDKGLLGSVKSLLAKLGVTPGTEHAGIGAMAANVNAAALSALACSSSVVAISLDAVVTASSDVAPAPYSVRGTLGVAADAPVGAGIGVAIIDSGIADSADLAGRISSFYDFTDGGRAAAPSDGYGHGSHVAGVIASSGVLSSGAYRGLAPGVRLIGLKVLDGAGSGLTSDVIRAVEFATTHRTSLGIDVINLSLGHPILEEASRDPLVRAVEDAVNAGIVVVVAAGNEGMNRQTGQVGYGGIQSPGNAPSAITVGALTTKDSLTRRDDEIASYSSRGPAWYDGTAKPDIVAPGHGIVSNAPATSALAVRFPEKRVGEHFLRLNGTSMAAAVASGAVAMLLDANRIAHAGAPMMTPNTVKAVLQYSSLAVREPSGAEYDALTEGAGALNVAGALTVASSIDTAGSTNYYWLTTPVVASTVIDDETSFWSERVIWGTSLLLGPSVDTNEPAWALGHAWGSSTSWTPDVVTTADVVWDAATQLWPSNLVGGTVSGTAYDDEDHIVWGTSYDDEDHIVWGTSSDDEDHIVWGTTEVP